ncbi:Down syndrome cell adhesion molecule-like protein Dscam2 [Nymphon striatum]|nr:Down syndrome cell adhesion molecule-like protein Dscam2 [Nymphon striatum]
MGSVQRWDRTVKKYVAVRQPGNIKEYNKYMGFKIFGTNGLSIKELVETDSGKYLCSAKNSHGQSKKHMQLTVMPVKKHLIYTEVLIKPTTTTLIFQTEAFLKEADLEKSQKDAVNIENTRQDETEMRNSEIKNKDEHDNYELAESKDSSFVIQNINLKAVMFIVPAAAVIILLIAIIITIVVYLVIRHKNMKNKKECRRSKDYSGIDTLNRSIQGKNYDQTGSLNRRYGKLERPLPIPNSETDQEQYEIPDYYAGMKPYSTLQYSARYQPQMNTMSRNSQAIYFSGILIPFNCEKLSGPVFIKEPNSGKAEFMNIEGLKLQCSAHGEPDPEIQWLKRDGYQEEKLVTDIPSLLEIYNDGTLDLKPFAPEDFRQDIHSTVFRCIASNIHGRIISAPVSVRATTKQQQQQIQAQVYDEYVVAGNTAVLKCHIPAFYKDDLEVVSWIREDNKIITAESSDQNFEVTYSGNLHMKSVSSDKKLNLGFWCQMKNKITGETFLSQSAGKIIVTDPQGGVAPVITDIMESISIERGEIANLHCAAQGSPPPSYEWTSRHEVISKSSNVLVTDTQDAGTYTYTCIVENKFGIDKSSVKVIIRSPIEIFIKPSVEVVDSGSELKLKCHISGHPIKQIKWLLNGKKLDDKTHVSVKSDGTLFIKKSRRIDEGMYQCFVSNDWEQVQATAQVILGDLPPKLIDSFKSRTLQPGPSISLKCTASGRPTPNIIWKYNDQYLEDNERFVFREKILGNGTVHSKVIIKSVRAIDGGEYTCMANNEVGNISHAGTINVYGLPMVHQMKNITVAAGQDAIIRCYVSGHPIKEIHWELNDIFSNLPENMRSYNNGTLVINKARKINSGKYSCIAKNGRGQVDKKSAIVKVLAKPVISGNKYDVVNMEEKEPFSAMCSVFRGDEPIKIIWKHNGKLIILKHGTDIATTKMYSVLQIREAKEHQAGNYTCFAQNEAGYDTRTIELKLNLPPKWVIQPKDIVTSMGSSVSIHCKTTGNPHPSIKWMKVIGRKVTSFIDENEKHVLYENGTVVMKEIDDADAGKYSCIADNGIGKPLVKKITLRIKDVPVINFLNNSIIKQLGEKLSIICKVSGHHLKPVQWYRYNDLMLEKKGRITIVEEKNVGIVSSTLSINDLVENDDGKYKCLAQNNHGQSSKVMQLTIIPSKKVVDMTDRIESTTLNPEILTKVYATGKEKHTIEKSQHDSVSVFETNDENKVFLSNIENGKELDEYNLQESKDSKFNMKKWNLKAVMFIVPGAAVVILLIAVIITIAVYLVIRHKNIKQKRRFFVARILGSVQKSVFENMWEIQKFKRFSYSIKRWRRRSRSPRPGSIRRYILAAMTTVSTGSTGVLHTSYFAVNRTKDYSGIDTLNRSIQGKNHDPSSTMERRYGQLERPLPLPNEDNYQDQYEIPDYCE